MILREKLICQNPHHPFKQKWYWFKPTSGDSLYLNSRKYCSSCASYLNFLKNILYVIKSPQNTLYGGSVITTDNDQLKALLDEVN